MKIALVHKKYTTHGGTERYMVNLSNFLAKEGHEVHVFTGSWDKEVANDEIIFHKTAYFGKKLGIDKYVFAKSAYKEVQKYNFDIVQTFSRTGFGDVIRIGGGCHEVYVDKMMETIDSPVYRLIKKLESQLSLSEYLTKYYEAQDFKSENYKKIVAISQTVKDQIMDIYQVPEEDIIINYNGVDINQFKPANRKKYRDKVRNKHGFDKEDMVLLFVGTGFKRKGLKYVLQAMAKVDKVELLVVGKGKINKYKKMAANLNIGSRVEFIGASSNVKAYYAAGDAFVFPTIYEPFGSVVTEALASGLPVITSQAAGSAEVLEEGKDGFVLESVDNVEQLSIYIDRLKDQSLRDKMSQAARKKALEYSEKRNHQNMLDIYQQILMEDKS